VFFVAAQSLADVYVYGKEQILAMVDELILIDAGV